MRTLVNELGSCRFVEKGDNVLLVGPTGTGGSPTLRRGWRMRRSRPVCRPGTGRPQGVHQHPPSGPVCRQAAGVLILDDFGLVPLSTRGAQDLYEIIRDRYERKSIILTSNRAPEEWAEVFGNSLLASAALDRLTHHSRFISRGVY